MKNVEIFLDKIVVYKNGNRGTADDLVLAVEWEDRNFGDQDSPSAIMLDEVKDGTPIVLSTSTTNVNRRLFKTRVEGDSVLKFTLLRKKELSGFGKLLGKLLSAAVVFGAGSATSGVGAVLAKKAAGQIFQFKDKWQSVLGETTYPVAEVSLDDGEQVINLLITPDAAKDLERLYTTRKMDRRVGRWIEETDQSLIEYLSNNQTNGEITISIKVYTP